MASTNFFSSLLTSAFAVALAPTDVEFPLYSEFAHIEVAKSLIIFRDRSMASGGFCVDAAGEISAAAARTIVTLLFISIPL